MMNTATMSCRCGKVRGRVVDAAPGNANRMICYCDDCQAYLHYLKRSDLLDEHAGTDIIQVAPATLAFEQGEENIEGVRLSPKGLFRWYARCCHTPLGNTMTPGIPFVGISASTFARPDDMFGRPTGGTQAKFAVGTPPPGFEKLKVGLVFGAFVKVLAWRLRGKVWPHPFFERASRAPSRPVHVITKAERDALRQLCGPQPAVAASNSVSPTAL